MDYFNVWLDPRKRTLVWPNDESRLSPPLFQKEIRTPRQALVPKRVHKAHQRDAEARDRALEQEDARRSSGARSQQCVKILTHQEVRLQAEPQATVVPDNCSY